MRTVSVKIAMPVKTIPLTQAKVAIVDDDDFERVNAFGKWHCIKSPYGYYAVRRHRFEEGWRRIWMHRIILGTREGYQTDHINGDGLDNQRQNLRQCSRSQNQANARKQRKVAASRFKGVHRTGSKWIARLQKYLNGKVDKRSLGTFSTQEEAALAYNQAAKEAYGEFALLNEVK